MYNWTLSAYKDITRIASHLFTPDEDDENLFDDDEYEDDEEEWDFEDDDEDEDEQLDLDDDL